MEVLVNSPVTLVTPVIDPPPVMLPVIDGALQPYVVPAGTIPLLRFVGVTANVTPLHVIAVIAVITADGFTVTVTLNTAPTQPPGDNGVTK